MTNWWIYSQEWNFPLKHCLEISLKMSNDLWGTKTMRERIRLRNERSFSRLLTKYDGRSWTPCAINNCWWKN